MLKTNMSSHILLRADFPAKMRRWLVSMRDACSKRGDGQISLSFSIFFQQNLGCYMGGGWGGLRNMGYRCLWNVGSGCIWRKIFNVSRKSRHKEENGEKSFSNK